MGHTLYYYSVKLTYGTEVIERSVKARTSREAIRIMKNTFIDKEFEKMHDYKIEAEIEMPKWNKE